MHPQSILSHLSVLRGDITQMNVLAIDEQVYQAISSFNVYRHNELYRSEMEKTEQAITKEGFGQWLVKEKLAKLLAAPSVEHEPSYMTYPFCPTQNDIMKSILLLTVCVGDDHIADFTLRDVYVHALCKKFTKGFKHALNRTIAESWKTLLRSLSLDLSYRESRYRPGYDL